MSSLPTPTPGPPPPPDASSPTRQSVAILAVVLGLVGGLCVLSIIIVFYRTRCKKSPSPTTDEAIAEALSTLRGRTISTSHPAARMVPFESRQHPQFQYTPGSEMRVAVRRPDGAWDFTQPGLTLGLNASRVNLVAVSSRESCSRNSLPRACTPISKERDDTASSGGQAEHDTDTLDSAPPAYGQEYRAYIDHVKEP